MLDFSNKDAVIVSKDGCATSLCVVVEGRMLTADCPEQENRDFRRAGKLSRGV